MDKELLALVEALKTEMKTQALWSETAPDASALASTEPFACDRLTFSQWLQFIFIPKFTAILKTGQPLPTNIAIAPAAQVWLRAHVSIQQLLNQIDQRVQTITTSKNN